MKFYSRIKNEIHKAKLELAINSKKVDDAYSMAIIQSLLNNKPYIPINGGALRPFCIAYILNEIIIGQRKSIIEFGSGMSTILISRLIQLNDLSVRFISVEHNLDWIEILKSQLKAEGLEGVVEFIHAELVPINTELGKVVSYDMDVVSRKILKIDFDLIVVDGPPANTSSSMFSRYPILLKLESNLSSDFCFIIDDAERKGEQRIIKEYQSTFPSLHYTLAGKTLGVFRKKIGFNPVPVYYSTRK